MSSEYKIGSTLVGMQLLTDLGISASPRPSYRPYADAVKLGTGDLMGQGFPVAEWHWDVMRIGESDILAGFLTSGLSGDVFIRTRLNRLSSGLYTWGNFQCVMNWPTGDEDIQSRKNLSLSITFTHMISA